MKYRAEIDGMRALAVIAVVVFHLEPDLMPGGYVGVDIFFVISGYLITTIIVDDVSRQRFSFANFYERRARRIMPALFVVLVTTYVVSWFLNLPAAHKVVGQYAVASVLSATNILLYLKGSDYFGLEEGNNPLFHMWSLGVEEQYYLMIPIVLLGILKFGRNWTAYFFALLISVSLLSIGVQSADFNFYMITSRAWELSVGSLVALAAPVLQDKSRPALALVGLIAIFLSYAFLSPDLGRMSYPLIVPVCGTALIILNATPGSLIARILGIRPLVTIGLLSYSIYLWHVPVLVFLRQLMRNSDAIPAFYLFTILTLSYLSWRFVEKPFRSALILPRRILLPVLVAPAISLIAFGTLGHLNGGHPERNAIFSSLRTNNGFGLQCNGNTVISDRCSTSSAPEAAVLGNSFSMMYVETLSQRFKNGLVQLTQDSCAVGYVDDISDVNALPCGDFYRAAVATITNSPSIQTVFVASPFDFEVSSEKFSASFIELIDDLGDRRIVIMGPPPSAPWSIGDCFFRLRVLGLGNEGDCDFEVSEDHTHRIAALERLIAAQGSAEFIDVTNVICLGGLCIVGLTDMAPLYIDRGHLSLPGAAAVLNRLIDAGRLTLD